MESKRALAAVVSAGYLDQDPGAKVRQAAEGENKSVVEYLVSKNTEVAVVVKTRGFKEVYQIDGGIFTYGKEMGDEGLWEGALYTFDNRMSIEFSDKSKSIAKCEKCSAPANRFYDCPKPPCNSLNLLCTKCAEDLNAQICNHPQRKYSNAELIG